MFGAGTGVIAILWRLETTFRLDLQVTPGGTRRIVNTPDSILGD